MKKYSIPNWMILKPNDVAEIIAPASRFTQERLSDIKNLLTSWKLIPKVSDDIFGDDLLCANSDENRIKSFKNAVLNPENKAIFCGRGGYGCARLMPELMKMPVPPSPKIFVGLSDITILNILLTQKWNWPVVYAAAVPKVFSEKSLNAIHELLFERTCLFPQIKSLNALAKKHSEITGKIVGGNLSLIQTTLGTPWQLETRDKIILIEETNERGYRVDRMLTHLKQMGLFESAKAVLLGDFLKGEESDGTTKIPDVLKRFAAEISVPVFHCENIGHGFENYPVPLNFPITLTISE